MTEFFIVRARVGSKVVYAKSIFGDKWSPKIEDAKFYTMGGIKHQLKYIHEEHSDFEVLQAQVIMTPNVAATTELGIHLLKSINISWFNQQPKTKETLKNMSLGK